MRDDAGGGAGAGAALRPIDRLAEAVRNGEVALDRLTEKGKAALLNRDIEAGTRSARDLTEKGFRLLAKHDMPVVRDEVSKRIQLAQSFRSEPRELPASGALAARRAEVSEHAGSDIFAPPEDVTQVTGKALLAGTGGTIRNLGSTLKWLSSKRGQAAPVNRWAPEDAPEEDVARYPLPDTPDIAAPLAEKIQSFGQRVMEKNYQTPAPYGGWRDFLNPKWLNENLPRMLSVNVTQSVPSMAALVVPSMMTGGAASAVAGAGKVAGLVASGLMNRAMESAMEAGGTYDEALAKGGSAEEADAAANKTFFSNMKLAGLDVGEYLASFAPGLKPASKLGRFAVGAGRLAATAGQEALEEGLQEKYQREALGEKFSWKAPATQEAMTVGALLGGIMGGAGQVSSYYTDVQKAASGKLTESQRYRLNSEIGRIMGEGKPWGQAAQEAMASMTDPDIVSAISEAATEVGAKYAERPERGVYQEEAGALTRPVPAPAESQKAQSAEAVPPQTQAQGELRVVESPDAKILAESEKEHLTPSEREFVNDLKMSGKSVDDLEKVARQDYDRLLGEELSYLESTMGQGVEQGGLIRDKEGNVTGRFGRQSRNAPWYSEWYKSKDRKPSRKELVELAAQRLREGGVVEGGEMAPPNQDFIEAEKSIMTAQYLRAKERGYEMSGGSVLEAVKQELNPPSATQNETPSTAPGRRTDASERLSRPSPSDSSNQGEISHPGASYDVSPAQGGGKSETGDILKDTVSRMSRQNMPRAVEEKYGRPGLVSETLKSVGEIMDAIRRKDETKLSDADVERVVTARQGPGTWAGNLAAKVAGIGDAFKDVFRYEWRVEDRPLFQDQLRRFQGTARDAQAWALETYLNIVYNLRDSREFGVFKKLVVLNDLLADIKNGVKVPGDLTQEQVQSAITELEPHTNGNILRALDAHNTVFKAAWEELQRRGKVSLDAESKEFYYPHKVMDYVRDFDRSSPAIAAKLKEPYRYYLKKRGGTARLIDTDYLTVTLNHFAKLYMDNATDDFALDMARQYDAWPNLSEKQRASFGGKPEAGRLYEIDGERYFGWSYDPFRRSNTPASRAVQDVLIESDPEAGKAGKASPDFLAQTHVLPEEIADRITRLREPGANLHFLKAARTAGWFWKKVVLSPFAAGIPWQAMNFLGDVINLIREDPAAVLLVPEAWKVAGQIEKSSVDPKYQSLVDIAERTRVNEAGLMKSGGLPYHPHLAELERGRYFMNNLNLFAKWETLGERRELSVRLAKLMKDLERIDRGESPVVRMFDVQKLRSAQMTDVEIAGKAAREFTVDYGRMTNEQKVIIRDLLGPFSTFHLGNFGNWQAYVRRNPGDFALKFVLPLAALAAYNYLAHGDEEERLPVYYRVLPHLITGYKTPDGKPIIVAFQTPLDMAAKMVGLDTTGDLARQVLDGKKDLDEAARELAGNMALGLPRTAWDLFSPFFKAPIEAAMNRNTFTDAPIVADAVKDTPEGVKKRLSYVAQQWLTPYGAYVRASKGTPAESVKEWLLEGPANIRKAAGIREVDTDREQISRFYDELKRLDGEYALWKRKRGKGEKVEPFADYGRLGAMKSAALKFSEQWKAVERIKADESRSEEVKQAELRRRYGAMAGTAGRLLRR